MTHHRQAESESDPRALREQVEHTREQLGATVEELAAKTDVKARLHDTATRAAHAASPAQAARAARSRPVPVAAGGLAVALTTALLLRRRFSAKQSRGRTWSVPQSAWRQSSARSPMERVAAQLRRGGTPMPRSSSRTARLAARCG
jgi:Protein of unknown function (DUF3618)